MLGQNHFAETNFIWVSFTGPHTEQRSTCSKHLAQLHIRNLTIDSSLNLHVNSYFLSTFSGSALEYWIRILFFKISFGNK
jgi:hypothetical protein